MHAAHQCGPPWLGADFAVYCVTLPVTNGVFAEWQYNSVRNNALNPDH
jgi:hypothetical protein